MLRKSRVVLALVSGLLLPQSLSAQNSYLEQVREMPLEETPAHRYANMSNREAFAELAARGIRYQRVREPVPGVRAPIRLVGRLRGVLIRSSLPETEWATTIYNILDARLALALDDLCRVLAAHDVVEVMHFTMYRKQGRDQSRYRYRHPGGLAIDLGAMRKSNGEWLSVGPHWPAQIGAKTCGQGARAVANRRGREIVSIACELSDQRIFHYMLTPHYDDPHSDHLHLEIKPGVKWFSVR